MANHRRTGVLALLILLACPIQGDIHFLESPQNVSASEGSIVVLSCKTDVPVELCMWVWESVDKQQSLMVDQFKPPGLTNNDCSLKFNNVTSEHVGLWTCKVQTNNENMLASNPALLRLQPGFTFVESPTNLTLLVGDTAKLPCITNIPIQSCQWKFQQQGQDDPIVLREYSPNDPKNCTLVVRFISMEQTGMWTCGARLEAMDNYTYTDPSYLTVEHREVMEGMEVEFKTEPSDTVMKVGDSGQLNCIVKDNIQIDLCQWSWQHDGFSEDWNIVVKEFLPTNNDCSLKFDNITTETEGTWTCQVKPVYSKEFFHSRSAQINIITEAKFVVLTRQVTVAEGEPMTLHCMGDVPLEECRWQWQSVKELHDPPVVVKTFSPYGDGPSDCSLYFSNVLVEQNGLWICGIKFINETKFKDALPTTMSITPATKIKFVGIPDEVTVAESQPAILPCTTTSAVKSCIWSVSQQNASKEMFSFQPAQNSQRNCSLVLENVGKGQQGLWTCTVKYGPDSNLSISQSSPIKLNVVKTVPIEFTELSKSIKMPIGSTATLRCVTSRIVEMCQWKVRGKNSTEDSVHSTFEPKSETDCSMQIDNLQLSDTGDWTCGARNPAEQLYTWAPSVQVIVLTPEKVKSTTEVNGEVITLSCHVQNTHQRADCLWLHPSKIHVSVLSYTQRYTVTFNNKTGECSLRFTPQAGDLGQWSCIFKVDELWETGQATFLIINSPDNVRLNWTIGALAAVSLVLTVMLSTVLTCKLYQCQYIIHTDKLANSAVIPNTNGKQPVRYTDPPTKDIKFRFCETADSVPHSHHIYEHVGPYITPRPMNSFYQNAD